MQYLRTSDQARALPESVGTSGTVSVLAQLESVTVLRVVTGAEGTAEQAWVSDVDRFLVVLDGELSLAVAGTEHRLAPWSVAVVPAGSRHRYRAAGAAGATHLELLVPSLSPGQPLGRPAGDTADDAAPDGASPGAAPLLTRLDHGDLDAGARSDGFAVHTLVSAASGVGSCVVNAARVAAGGAGPPLHIHHFDQLFIVLEGELSVAVADQQVSARRHDLVVLPAGVAHTQWNESSTPEVHLAVLVPPPGPGEPVTRAVQFAMVG